MSNKIKYALFAITAYIITSLPAHSANPVAFKALPESHIKFQATQGGAAVNGEFKNFTADINFHPEALAASKAIVTIDTGSVISGDKDAQEALPGAEWFNVKSFPQAVFETTSFKFLGGNKYEALGNLTIKGHSEAVTLSFILNEFSPTKSAVTGEVVIKRKAFKIGEESTDSIKDEVKVTIDIKAGAK